MEDILKPTKIHVGTTLAGVNTEISNRKYVLIPRYM